MQPVSRTDDAEPVSFTPAEPSPEGATDTRSLTADS